MSGASGLDLLPIIRCKYGSLEAPKFFFVQDALSKRPYDPLVQQLREDFAVEEDTDPNDDVSFGYLLSRNTQQWRLELSMLGPFAVLLRITEPGHVDLVSHDLTARTEQEESILAILQRNDIKIMERNELVQPVAIKLQNTSPQNSRLYQALFGDTDILPWHSD